VKLSTHNMRCMENEVIFVSKRRLNFWVPATPKASRLPNNMESVCHINTICTCLHHLGPLYWRCSSEILRLTQPVRVLLRAELAWAQMCTSAAGFGTMEGGLLGTWKTQVDKDIQKFGSVKGQIIWLQLLHSSCIGFHDTNVNINCAMLLICDFGTGRFLSWCNLHSAIRMDVSFSWGGWPRGPWWVCCP